MAINKTPGETLSKSQLEERGWTDAGIRKFLGEPDATRPNPKYKSAAPMSLYQLDRVEAAEQTPEYLVWKAKSQTRRDAASGAVMTKKASLRAMIERWRPEVPVLDVAKLRRKAIANYNSHREQQAGVGEGDWNWTPATESSDEAFLARITVNYVRHVLTNYDGLLAALHGKVGVKEARNSYAHGSTTSSPRYTLTSRRSAPTRSTSVPCPKWCARTEDDPPARRRSSTRQQPAVPDAGAHERHVQELRGPLLRAVAAPIVPSRSRGAGVPGLRLHGGDVRPRVEQVADEGAAQVVRREGGNLRASRQAIDDLRDSPGLPTPLIACLAVSRSIFILYASTCICATAIRLSSSIGRRFGQERNRSRARWPRTPITWTASTLDRAISRYTP
jgi:hypothetical protein